MKIFVNYKKITKSLLQVNNSFINIHNYHSFFYLEETNLDKSIERMMNKMGLSSGKEYSSYYC